MDWRVWSSLLQLRPKFSSGNSLLLSCCRLLGSKCHRQDVFYLMMSWMKGSEYEYHLVSGPDVNKAKLQLKWTMGSCKIFALSDTCPRQICVQSEPIFGEEYHHYYEAIVSALIKVSSYRCGWNWAAFHAENRSVDKRTDTVQYYTLYNIHTSFLGSNLFFWLVTAGGV